MSQSLFFPILLGAIALYVLYEAIRGKGRLFKAEFIKEKFEAKFVPYMRLFYFALALLMLLQTTASVLQSTVYEEAVTYEFTEAYTNKAGTSYKTGIRYSTEEMQAIVSATAVPDPNAPEQAPAPTAEPAASGSLCAPAAESEPADYSIQQNVDHVPKSENGAFVSYKTLTTLSTIFMIAALVVLVGLFVALNLMTDKVKRREAQAQVAQQSSHMPSAAFDFEEKKEK